MSHTSDHGAPKTQHGIRHTAVGLKNVELPSSGVEVDPMARRKDGGRWGKMGCSFFLKMFCVGPFVSGR